MKKVLIGIYFFIISISYCETYWNGNYHNENLVILYKVLDPLVVTVEEPQRIKLPAMKGTYRYSENSDLKRTLKVQVKADYIESQIDDILRKVYERVFFELQNSGSFELKNEKDENKKIIGKGYFIDKDAGATETTKLYKIDKSFAESVGGKKFSAETEIDVDFEINDPANTPMGIYRGVLKLDVWFSGK